MGSKQYEDCKFAIAHALMQTNVARNQVKLLTPDLEKNEELPVNMAMRCLLNAIEQQERALRQFLEHDDDAMGKNRRNK